MSEAIEDSDGDYGDEDFNDNDLNSQAVAAASAVQKGWDDMLSSQENALVWELNQTVSDWGKLQAMYNLAGSCAVGELDAAAYEAEIKPALLWYALGVIMPAKYQLHYQRNYYKDSPDCYFKGSDGKLDTDRVYTAVNSLDVCDKMYLADRRRRNDWKVKETRDCSAERGIWLSTLDEEKSQPPADFYDSVASSGVVDFLNTYYSASYSEDLDGVVEIFGSQCLFLPSWKKDTSLQYVYNCSVYGANLMASAKEDCKWESQDDYRCYNGHAQDLKSGGDQWLDTWDVWDDQYSISDVTTVDAPNTNAVWNASTGTFFCCIWARDVTDDDGGCVNRCKKGDDGRSVTFCENGC